jgi:small Trp-rich protein
MAFLILGLALLAMKAAEFGPVANWSWLVVLAPFGLAVLWWAFADSTGLTQRRAIEKMERRKEERRKRDMEALGLAHRPNVRGRSRKGPTSRFDASTGTTERRDQS